MQGVIALLRTVLVQLSLNDGPKLKLSDDLIVDAFESVASHQIFDHLILASAYEKRLANAA